MRTVSDGGARLFVGGVSVADGDHEARFTRGVNAGHRAQKFRSDGENLCVAFCGGNELLEPIRRWEFQEFRREDAAAAGAAEGAFRMNAEGFRAGALGLILAGTVNEGAVPDDASGLTR